MKKGFVNKLILGTIILTVFMVLSFGAYQFLVFKQSKSFQLLQYMGNENQYEAINMGLEARVTQINALPFMGKALLDVTKLDNLEFILESQFDKGQKDHVFQALIKEGAHVKFELLGSETHNRVLLKALNQDDRLAWTYDDLKSTFNSEFWLEPYINKAKTHQNIFALFVLYQIVEPHLGQLVTVTDLGLPTEGLDVHVAQGEIKALGLALIEAFSNNWILRQWVGADDTFDRGLENWKQGIKGTNLTQAQAFYLNCTVKKYGDKGASGYRIQGDARNAYATITFTSQVNLEQVGAQNSALEVSIQEALSQPLIFFRDLSWLQKIEFWQNLSRNLLLAEGEDQALLPQAPPLEPLTPIMEPPSPPAYDLGQFKLYNYDTTKVVEVTDPTQYTVLVNRWNKLNSKYKPEDLVAPDVDFSFPEEDQKRYLRKEVAQALEALFAGALDADYKLVMVSGFRSYSRQSSVYSGWVKKYGKQSADTFSAQAGHSEHQTGLAVDISCEAANNIQSEVFASTPEGQWVALHAHEYGFIVRYPKGKTQQTGYVYEPWHLRYLGIALATDIYDSGLTLEEFYKEKAAIDKEQ